jgi:hypothetical protein
MRASICASLGPCRAIFAFTALAFTALAFTAFDESPPWNNDLLFAKSKKGDSMSADERLIGMYRMMSLACDSMDCDCPGFFFKKM